jgi:Ca-activated chloride channel family protein
MLHFDSPWWILLILAVALGMFIAWRRRPPTLSVSTARPFQQASDNRRTALMLRLPLCLTAVGMLCLVIALMRPQLGTEQIIRRSEGVDIMLALDVSGSMEAYDLPPDIDTEQRFLGAVRDGRLKSRVQIAREQLEAFVKKRPNDLIGLIAFAQLPYVVAPPTLDHQFLMKRLELLDAGELPDGTGIAAPIASATNRLRGSPAKRRVLVLFTDGENNVDAAITPEQAAKAAKTFDVIAYTVGVGSQRSVIVRQSPFGARLHPGAAGFNRELLEKIANITGGRYFEAHDEAGFRNTMREIDELEKRTVEQMIYIDYRERFMPWLAAGLIFLLAGFLLEHTILQTVP